MKIIPITPSEVGKSIDFPEFVIQGINNSIKKHYHLGGFTISQDNLLTEILKIAPSGITSDIIFQNHWLDFEKLYRKFGWDITYDKPGYNESYNASFKFKEINK